MLCWHRGAGPSPDPSRQLRWAEKSLQPAQPKPWPLHASLCLRFSSHWVSTILFPFSTYILFSSFTDAVWINFQVGWELSRWLSRIIRSLSLKGVQWLWNAPTHFLGALISFGMSNIPTEVSSSFWNTSRGTTWLKATLVLRRNFIRAKPLSTWRNRLFLGMTLRCTSVLEETQWWGLQGELNANPWEQ